MSSRPGIALQMYTVREDSKADYLGTLSKVAEIGYTAVELAGYGDLPAEKLRMELQSRGLDAIASHVSFDRLMNDLDREVEYCLAIGNRNVVCSSLPDPYRNEAGFRRAADAFNKIGRHCSELGARLSYHTHAFEFERFGNVTGLDILLSGTDAAAVNWEPDIYWMVYAGVDPIATLQHYATRWPLVHLKDMTSGPNPTFAEIGEGKLDFAPIFAATENAEWYIVEQDRCARPALESIAISMRHLRAWGKA